MIRILYIEDDPQLSKHVPRLLRSSCRGAAVTHVDTYEDAIAHLQAIPCDLVLSDYDLLPGTRGSGGSLLTWIEKNLPHLKARFIFLSSNEACKDRGVPWLEKPCSTADLVGTINRVLTLS